MLARVWQMLLQYELLSGIELRGDGCGIVADMQFSLIGQFYFACFGYFVCCGLNLKRKQNLQMRVEIPKAEPLAHHPHPPRWGQIKQRVLAQT